MLRSASLCLVGTLALPSHGDLAGHASTPGHSAHGPAFDRGPRQKPWIIDGIGSSHFPITTSQPEAQKWFDQGHTLIHSFWYYEAERAFRWCLKLDPNAAMAYWGLARSYYWRERDIEREAALMQEASKRKAFVSERERMYIEAWEELYTPDAIKAQKGGGAAATSVRQRLLMRLQHITTKYPDDIEAKALLAWESRGVASRDEIEALLQQVLTRAPDHPGAHHYRIHIWDGRDAERSLDSAAAYARIVTGIGHAIHMPGHTYSVLGKWHEAARAMINADRVEREYLQRTMELPFDSWNYAHNRNYLSYVQEQLGMADDALKGARALLAAPLDPAYNNPDEYGTHWQGQLALVRGLIKFERWNELLATSTTTHWRPVFRDRMWRTYAETLAHLGLRHLSEARRSADTHGELRHEIGLPLNKSLEDIHRIQSLELGGALAIASGDFKSGCAALADGARHQAKWMYEGSNNDPPVFGHLLFVELGRAYLRQGRRAQAATAFEQALTVVKNDGFALAGLVEAYGQLREHRKAADALSRLLAVWSNADRDLTWLVRASALAAGAARQNAAQELQPTAALPDSDLWQPYMAPSLDGFDAAGQRVSLEAYRGKTVLLVFSIGQQCAPCVRQLNDLGKRVDEFRQLGAEVVGISADASAASVPLQKPEQGPFRLMSDATFENARRFKAYDEFEDLPLAAMVLIDQKGRVHWTRSGGAPFEDIGFLLQEIRRLDALSRDRDSYGR